MDALAALARPEGPWQLVHCWTHVRRRFVKRLENDGSSIAEQALRQSRSSTPLRHRSVATPRRPGSPRAPNWRRSRAIPQSSKGAGDTRYTLGIWPGLSLARASCFMFTSEPDRRGGRGQALWSARDGGHTHRP
jgi:transposase